MKSLVSNVLSFKSWIYDTVDVCNFVINEFNPAFQVQKMGNEAFQNVLFGNASFPNEALSYNCLWVMFRKGLIKRILKWSGTELENGGIRVGGLLMILLLWFV